MDSKRIEDMARMSHASPKEAVVYDAYASLALEGERYAHAIRTSEKGMVARDRLIAAARRVVEAEEARLDPNSGSLAVVEIEPFDERADYPLCRGRKWSERGVGKW